MTRMKVAGMNVPAMMWLSTPQVVGLTNPFTVCA